MKPAESVKLLKKHGWVIDRIAGGQHIMIEDGKRFVFPVIPRGGYYGD
jgi:predicted RNA binding protein YcfA (HicA-like mRNA interferase family)